MKTLYYVFVFYFLTSGVSYGQGLINNHWKLGKIDLNFSTDPLVVNSSNNDNYGYATISDNNGELLFYTDGVKVWNKNHNVMTNGSQIGFSYVMPSQRCVIVPHPGNANKYYIFNTRTDLYLNSGSSPSLSPMLSYSLVDFTNNPLGELLPVGNSLPYSKVLAFWTSSDLPPVPPDYKPLTVARNNDNTGFFVITQNYYNMVSFKVDVNGLNESPILSPFQNNQIYNVPHPYGTSFRGIQASMIRISPDGLKLVGLESSGYQADILNYHSHLYSLNFNNQTGQFTGYQDQGWYGGLADNFEFSSNSQLVYIVRNGGVIVKDLANLSQPVRILTVFNMPSTYASVLSGLQRDRFDNLWINSSAYGTSDMNKYLHKIENQNSFANASVKLNEISLNMAVPYLEFQFPQLVLETKQGCKNNLNLISPELNNTYTYHSSDNIILEQNYLINAGKNITMKAGNFISIKPNAHIKSGATFLAKIEQCVDQRTSATTKKDESFNREESIKGSDILSKLYPNPTEGSFRITLGEHFTGITSFEIFDILGKSVYKGSSSEHSFDVNISNLTLGVYTIKLFSNSHSEMIKFIKQ